MSSPMDIAREVLLVAEHAPTKMLSPRHWTQPGWCNETDAYGSFNPANEADYDKILIAFNQCEPLARAVLAQAAEIAQLRESLATSVAAHRAAQAEVARLSARPSVVCPTCEGKRVVQTGFTCDCKMGRPGEIVQFCAIHNVCGGPWPTPVKEPCPTCNHGGRSTGAVLEEP